MKRCFGSIVLASGLFFVAAAPADAQKPKAKRPPTDLETLLAHEIVGPVLPLTELQTYCDARVPRMGTFRSVAE